MGKKQKKPRKGKEKTERKTAKGEEKRARREARKVGEEDDSDAILARELPPSRPPPLRQIFTLAQCALARSASPCAVLFAHHHLLRLVMHSGG